jgi:NTP pyrophosphatase (non-canonical NTP hydrolase)
MSLTLRDAQYLCWKTFKKLEAKNKKQLTESEMAANFVKKAGDLAEKIQRTEGSSGAADKENLGKRLSEMLYVAFVLAESYGVTLEESFMQTIDEYILGFVS